MVLNESINQAQNLQELRGTNSEIIPVQAPIGGWNTRDAFDDVPPVDAILMENWVPGLGSVAVRGGCAPHCILHDEVSNYKYMETLVAYSYNGVNKLICCARDNFASADGFWDVTSSTKVFLAVASGGDYGTRRWQHAQYGEDLVFCNGQDEPLVYNLTEADIVPISDNNPALVGPTAPIGVHTFKNRMYYWDSNSASFWYTDLLALSGNCTEFDIEGFTKYGGHIMHIDSLTLDGGMGPDDYFVIFMNTGEVIIYRGSSPSSQADWSIVGTYYIGTLMGPRAICKMGGDLFCATTLDIINLGALLQGEEALSKRTKISGAMEEISYLAGTFGFDAVIHPSKKLMIFNIPDAGGELYSQYVMNIVTGAWCKFTGWPGVCWAESEGKVYFGVMGDDEAADTEGNYGFKGAAVYETFDGDYDGVANYSFGTGQKPIESTLQTAWLNMGSPINKTYHAIKPILRSNTSVNLNIAIAVDFDEHGALLFPSATEVTGTPWGSAWGSPWGPAGRSDVDWQIVDGYGRWASALVKMATKNALAWASSLWHIERGEAL